MSQKFKIGDLVRVAIDEGLDTPHEARDKVGIVTGYLRDDNKKVVEWWVTSLEFAKFNAASYHITKVYEMQYVVRSQGQGIPGRHLCTGCRELFVKNEIYEIGSVLLPDDKYAVVNVHQRQACQDAAIVAVT